VADISYNVMKNIFNHKFINYLQNISDLFIIQNMTKESEKFVELYEMKFNTKIK